MIQWLSQFESVEDRVRFIRTMRTRGAVRPVRIEVLNDVIVEKSSKWSVKVLDELYWLMIALKAKRGGVEQIQ